MSWNYRVIKRMDKNEDPYFTIHEVYYTKEGLPHSVSTEPIIPIGGSKEELAQDLARYTAALLEPELNYNEIGTFKNETKESG